MKTGAEFQQRRETAIYNDGAGVRAREACHEAEECAFPRAVRPDHGHTFAMPEFERNVLDGREALRPLTGNPLLNTIAEKHPTTAVVVDFRYSVELDDVLHPTGGRKSGA